MSGEWGGGKGDKRRPSSISDEEYGLRFDVAFGRIRISREELDRRIKEIRERKGKP